jgi:hypothetical protein
LFDSGINLWSYIIQTKSIAMKNLLALLLLAAAAVGAYFFFFKKKPDSPVISEIKKEWVIGKWKIDSVSLSKDTSDGNLMLALYATDSAAKKDVHQFLENGTLLTMHPADSLPKNDTTYYQWAKENEILFKEKVADSTGTSMLVKQIDENHMSLQTKDSSVFYLLKEK